MNAQISLQSDQGFCCLTTESLDTTDSKYPGTTDSKYPGTTDSKYPDTTDSKYPDEAADMKTDLNLSFTIIIMLIDIFTLQCNLSTIATLGSYKIGCCKKVVVV